ncbi:MAG: tetratricopeptide repeat protein [Candidatus Aenigmarchaeota archaeon]|nr:tetratricopeptide repeat protein [Candidatus Aenigmarchaeota archaeon]
MVLAALFFSACSTTQNLESINNAEAHNKLGYLYLSNSQFNKAFIEFQKAINLNPKNKEAFNYLGYISARFKKYNEAISYYKRAISIDPDYSDAMNNLGVVYLDINNWEEAINYFNSALSNPMYSTPEKAYTSMGYAYYKKGDYSKAESVLKESLIRNPVFPLAMYTLGLVYIKLEKYDYAIKELKKAIGIVPDYYEAHLELGKTYILIGKKGKASKHFEVVADEDEDIERRRKASEYIRHLTN